MLCPLVLFAQWDLLAPTLHPTTPAITPLSNRGSCLLFTDLELQAFKLRLIVHQMLDISSFLF